MTRQQVILSSYIFALITLYDLIKDSEYDAIELLINRGINMNEKINKIDERIQKQEEEIKRLKALKRKAESTMKAKERERQRKNDTRRKILIGACMMKLADENQDEKERLLKQLDKFLINEKDRSLFNL
ncbi:Mobilization protein mobS [Wohlfahrtiimonas chitiniclastica SH04]|uniref:Mobilization protein mobS n=2 Tax=Wohlfahrtiimonas chitiniclastica TaxID=400946 RepID=L8XXY2_9GAMM|nr:hypothetical protein [Wohlfahrtiimonas chitiniclastica]ELV07171.1 Mobilization protein mobS [Wohlfahrtiimonas chitiniclastica SH04]